MSAPILYLYDAEGWLTGQREAQEHPAAPGEYLTDVLGGTLLPPPESVPALHAPRFDAVLMEWSLQEDHFGREGWLDGQPHTIAAHGPPPDGWTEEEPAPPAPTHAEVRAATLTAITGAFEGACAALLAGEPPSASATYATQEAEAEAYTRSPAAPTPMLDMLAAARGLDKADLVARVLRKAALYKQASGFLLGQQQALADAVSAIIGGDGDDAAKIAALEGLEIRIGLPGGE